MDDDLMWDVIGDVTAEYYGEGDDVEDADYDLLGDESEAEDELLLLEEGDYYDEGEDSAEARRGRWRRRLAGRQRARRLARARALARARGRRGRGLRGRRRYVRAPRPYMAPARSRGKASTRQVRQGFSRVKDDMRRTKATVARVDLESKVKADALKEATTRQGKRIGGTEYAMAATKIIDEIKTQFPKINDDKVLRTLVPLLPLALLRPPKKGTGIESLVRDPRAVGAAVAGAIAIFQSMKPEPKPEPTPKPALLRLAPSNDLFLTAGGGKARLNAVVLDQNRGAISTERVTWRSLNTNVAAVDSNTGEVTGVAAGNTTIIATSLADPAVFESITVKVE